MTSTVLARKYRPRHFESMVGQGHVVQALANALTQQRLHHAYLFTGTRGVGKTTVSRILAKSLNCVGADGKGTITAQPCGQCQPCRDIDAGRFVDYVELDAASNRGVEEISQLLDQAVYKPVVGRFKVYMIDEVHMLSSHAFNAMLKTLEEPPDYLKFVLATTDPQKVPVTVLSRCLQFNLRPMAVQTIEEHLQHVLAQEAIEAEPAALSQLARAARGSMRDALSLADQAIAYGGGKLEDAVVRQMLGAVDKTHVLNILQALAASDGRALVNSVDELRRQGLSAVGALDELIEAWQQLAMCQAVPELMAHDARAQALSGLVARFQADEIQLYYSLALQGRQELTWAPDEYAGLNMVVLRWLAFRPAATGALQAEPPPAQRPKASGPALETSAGPDQSPQPPPWVDEPDLPVPAPQVSVAAPLPLPPVAPAVVTPPKSVVSPEPVFVAPTLPADTALASRWADVVAQLQQRGLITALVRELAMQAECVRVQEDADTSVWTLRVERESLRQDAHRDRLSQAMQQLLGGQHRLSIEAGVVRDTPAFREQAAKARRQAAAESLIHQDPLVMALLDNYPGAKVIPGSVMPL